MFRQALNQVCACMYQVCTSSEKLNLTGQWSIRLDCYCALDYLLDGGTSTVTKGMRVHTEPFSTKYVLVCICTYNICTCMYMVCISTYMPWAMLLARAICPWLVCTWFTPVCMYMYWSYTSMYYVCRCWTSLQVLDEDHRLVGWVKDKEEVENSLRHKLLPRKETREGYKGNRAWLEWSVSVNCKSMYLYISSIGCSVQPAQPSVQAKKEEIGWKTPKVT